MARKLKFKKELSTSKGYITKCTNTHTESLDVDLYYLHDKDDNFIDKDINFNTLKDKLVKL